MMHGKKFTIILTTAGERIKRINISVAFLPLLVTLAISSATLLGFLLYDYHGLRQSIASIGQMSQKVVEQRDEIAQQRLQIQAFAKEINTLKNKLVKLNEFERKLRAIANLEPADREGSLFGVGGATPEDLEPRLNLNQAHHDLMRDMHWQINELDEQTLRQSNSFDRLMDTLEDQRNLLASTPAIRPTKGWTTSRFGYRTSPFTGRRELHKGVDIAHRKGTPILATARGVVTFAGRKGQLGRIVVIDHGHGVVTRYAHLSKTLKKKGETVERSDIIGQMGNSGRSTGPHLHYEVHLNGIPVNPEKYILN
jgi:murein DD-endopeptidase MepM/ murein hydrolase activator NlpD